MTNPKSDSKYRLPPLHHLRAFEAAARFGSFTRAADSLAVTQGAVSQSVKLLEDYLQIQLFERTATGLKLTDGSKAYANALRDAFASIEHATEALRTGRTREVLTILSYPSVISHWLSPRLPFFQLEHQHIELLTVSANPRVQIDPDAADLRIQYGDGNWKGSESLLLYRDELCPVCSPRLLERTSAPYALQILDSLTLLHANSRRDDWPEWLALASTGARSSSGKDQLYFEELSIVYRAAVSGLGIAMGQRALLGDYLAHGLLYEPFTTVLRREIGYYLTWFDERRDVPKIRAFRTWIASHLAMPPPDAEYAQLQRGSM